MEKIYFISIENTEIGQTKFSQYGFPTLDIAIQALKETIEDYKEENPKWFDNDYIEEEYNETTYYATDNCGLHIYIEIQSLEIPKF